MATEFTLNMKMGNAAMLTGGDIAERLRVTANKIEANYETDYLDEWTGLGGGIHDTNGNSLGRWGIETVPDDESDRKRAEEIVRETLALRGVPEDENALRNRVTFASYMRQAVHAAFRAARGER